MTRSMLTVGRPLVIALALAGCVVSTESVIASGDATFDPRLLGTWVDVGDGDRAVVSRGAGDGYAIEFTDDGKTGRFAARLGRLGDRMVLDVWPTPEERELPEPYAAALLPVHVPVVIQVDSNEVRLWLVQPDTLRAVVAASAMQLPWTPEQNRMVLRGTTAQLRTALTGYVARPGALDKPDVFRRVSDVGARR